MNLQKVIDKIFSGYKDRIYSHNLMDNKKDNFVIKGIWKRKTHLFGLKLIDKEREIRQEFVDQGGNKVKIGFDNK